MTDEEQSIFLSRGNNIEPDSDQQLTPPTSDQEGQEEDEEQPRRSKRIISRQSSQEQPSSKVEKKKSRRAKKEKKRKKKNETELQFILSELMGDMGSSEDLSKQTMKYMQGLKWYSGLAKEDIELYKPIYYDLCKKISDIPRISDILKTSMPYEEKCDIIEKILILNNSQPNTFEFLQLKKLLNRTLEKYKYFDIAPEEYEKYKQIEEALENDKVRFIPLKYRILGAELSNSNKAYIYQRYKYFSNLESTSSEYVKLKQWIECALSLPTQLKPVSISMNDTAYKINKYLWNVKALLDKEIYGLADVKEKILFLLNNRITNNYSKGSAMALCGPPGVAKTSIINTLSRAIELPLSQISLAGAKDSSFLLGHSYTYEGAVPGAIVQAISNAGHNNCILYFDEFDKISDTPYGAELSRSLLQITDFSQNDKYHDRYLSNNIDIDLSNVWFIYSLNDKDLIDRTLCDRIPIIEIAGYDAKEKFDIAKLFLIPKALENVNISKSQVMFNDPAIWYLIEVSDKIEQVCDSNRKSGVRQLKHLIDNLLMKINLLRTTSASSNKTKTTKYKLTLSFGVKDFKIPILITPEIIEEIGIKNTVEKEDISFMRMYM